MRSTFFRLSWAYFRRHVPTSVLTLLGVALGVAVFVAIDLAGLSLTDSLRRTVDQIAGKVQLEASFGDSGVPEEKLESIQKLPEVSVASPVIQAVVRPDRNPNEAILIIATDLLGDRSLREYDLAGNEDAIDDPLVFLAQPDSIALTREYAEREHLKLNDPFILTTAAGRKTFIIRGLLAPNGIAKAYGGNLAMMDIYAAQLVLGRGRRFDRIDIRVNDGVSLAAGKAALEAALGAGYTVATPASRSAQLESLLENFKGSLQMSSVQALLIGIFLIYNIFSVAVTRRRQEIGTLRALGATRAEITRMCLGEALVLGLFGSLIGLWAGRLLAAGAFRFMRSLVEDAYGINQIGRDDLTASPLIFIGGLILGLAAALLAAWWPARQASRVDPVDALAGGAFEKKMARIKPGLVIFGALLITAGLAILLWPPLRLPAPLVFGGLIILNFGALALAPAGTLLLGRALSHLPVPGLRAEARLALDALMSAPRRTIVTTAALLIAAAFVINSGGFASAFQNSFNLWMDDTLNADLYVTNSERFLSRASQFPPAVGDSLRAIPGVRSVEPIRNFRMPLAGKHGEAERNTLVLTADFSMMLKRIKLQISKGDPAVIQKALIDGTGLVISDNLELVLGYRVGDELPIVTPAGRFSLPVVGVIREYSSDQGCIFLPRARALEMWRDDSVDTYDLMLDDPARRLEVKRAVLAKLGAERTVFVFTGEEFRGAIQTVIDKFFALSYVQVLIAVLVATMGIANALLIGVFERRRELGLLKALGASRGQIAWLIGLEAAAVTLIGAVLGLLFGAVLNLYSLRIIGVRFGGWLLPYRYPWGIAGLLLPLLMLSGIVAALYPAWIARKVEPAQALQYE